MQFTEADSTASLLTSALNNPGKTGLDLVGIRARNRVLDVLDALKKANEDKTLTADNLIKLEEADYLTAQQAIREVRWASADKHLITFAVQFGL